MSHRTFLPRSGEQLTLRAGPYRATVTTVGATLRELDHADRPLILRFDADEPAPAAHGQLLAPWPNRLPDGRYAFDGHTLGLALDEQEPPSALHGLVRWETWTVAERAADRVRLTLLLGARPGYPWPLELTAAYALDPDEGLRVTVTARNAGGHRAPYGLGAHPYLTAGSPLGDCTLEVPAGRALYPDARLRPDGPPRQLAGTSEDFRTARPVGDTVLNHSYTDLVRDIDGRTRVTLRSPDGPGVTLWADARHPWLQLYTADHFGRPGLAVEPMTCPPGALASGDDLAVLAPGDQHTATWGIRTA
ncbi:aldose 1-epimerase family protein [Streptomyces triticagri]|uniref:aldose 1-epimerase family protein n=1 Tax=Streptomyces triticagri TaxID=2293568 RepID=UPI0018F748F5|nr:aldose 1-epimerase family protein [Streptomyces triticagri]